MTGIWISSLNLWSLHSVLQDLFALWGHAAVEANGPQLLLTICGRNGLLQGWVRVGTSLWRGNKGVIPCRGCGGRTRLAALVNTPSSPLYSVLGMQRRSETDMCQNCTPLLSPSLYIPSHLMSLKEHESSPRWWKGLFASTVSGTYFLTDIVFGLRGKVLVEGQP